METSETDTSGSDILNLVERILKYFENFYRFDFNLDETSLQAEAFDLLLDSGDFLSPFTFLLLDVNACQRHLHQLRLSVSRLSNQWRKLKPQLDLNALCLEIDITLTDIEPFVRIANRSVPQLSYEIVLFRRVMSSFCVNKTLWFRSLEKGLILLRWSLLENIQSQPNIPINSSLEPSLSRRLDQKAYDILAEEGETSDTNIETNATKTIVRQSLQTETSVWIENESSALTATSMDVLIPYSLDSQSVSSRSSEKNLYYTEKDFFKTCAWPAFYSAGDEIDPTMDYSCTKVIGIEEAYVDNHCSFCGADFSGDDMRRRGIHLAYEHSFGNCDGGRLDWAEFKYHLYNHHATKVARLQPKLWRAWMWEHIDYEATKIRRLNAFRYTLLDKTKRQIRLLHLHPGSGRNGIDCHLEIADLDVNPSYEALSYEWGDPQDSRYIIQLDQHSILVRENLWWALWELRSSDKTRIFWVDAICINQDDVLEKNHQVFHMGDIYSHAHRVVAWIGREGIRPQRESTFNAVALLSKLMSSSVERYHETQTHNWDSRFDGWDSLADLCYRSYWSRLWIIQEVLLASKLLVQCGPLNFQWEEISNVCHYIQQGAFLPHHSIKRIKDSVPFRLEMRRKERRLAVWEENNDDAIPLKDLCSIFHDAECFDARDKLFGLKSLCLTCCQKAVPTDYSMNFNQVLGTLRDHHLAEHVIDTEISIEHGGGQGDILVRLQSYGGPPLAEARKRKYQP